MEGSIAREMWHSMHLSLTLNNNVVKQHFWLLHQERNQKIDKKMAILVLNSNLNQLWKVYLQEYCSGWCFFIVQHSATMWWTRSFFGCFTKCLVLIKLINMDKLTILVLNSFLHESKKVYLQKFCGVWWIFIVWHSTTMWWRSFYGCFNQCFLNKSSNTCSKLKSPPVHQSWNFYFQFFCGGWCISIVGGLGGGQGGRGAGG